jgi:hypothetical protein
VRDQRKSNYQLSLSGHLDAENLALISILHPHMVQTVQAFLIQDFAQYWQASKRALSLL